MATKAQEFCELAVRSFPSPQYFNGGYMPEEQEDEEDRGTGPRKKTSQNKKSESLSESFLLSVKDAFGRDYLEEEKWSADVKTKKHPPEGKFTQGAEAIAKWLKSSHDSLKSAAAALNFYRNRNPDNMSQDKHDSILGMLHTAYGA